MVCDVDVLDAAADEKQGVAFELLGALIQHENGAKKWPSARAEHPRLAKTTVSCGAGCGFLHAFGDCDADVT
jgi:hypothetical protein